MDEVAVELGLGRRWVMSPWGRTEAAERWREGDYGPDSAMSRATKRVCRDCGFFLPLAGSLGEMFGVCGNELSADGHVVDKFYGCGAHSDTPAPAGTGSPMYEPYDDGVLDVVDRPAPESAVEAVEAVEPEVVEPAVEAVEPEPEPEPGPEPAIEVVEPAAEASEASEPTGEPAEPAEPAEP